MKDIELFGFEKAVKLLKSRKKVARKAWNNEKVYIQYIPEYRVEIKGYLGSLIRSSYIEINNVNGTTSMWIPSINDYLAKDWYEVLD